MLRGRKISILYCAVAVIAVIVLIISSKTYKLNTTDKFVVSYFPNNTGIAVYEVTSQNTMKCNLTTVNTIISNMISADYFYIVKDHSEGYLLDIMLTNDVEEYRIFYNRRTRDFMCLSKPFLRNYVPQTYIHG